MNDPRGVAALAPETDPRALDPDALARVIAALRGSAAARDRAGGHAAQEKQWLADAGLLTLAVPRAFGGQEAAWPAIYDAIRQLG
ncbi:acyl-CoA dehydrogenase, partial [Paraburkholderia sp. Se-20369]|nr:acyl-CoA dehydrogenase [Paraburkholderia sp. Se-20369]